MEVSVRLKPLRGSARELKGIAVNINQAAHMIDLVASNLDTRMDAYATVAAKLKNYSASLETIGKKTRKLGAVGVRIAYLYEEADKETANSENFVSKVAWGMGLGALGPLGDSIDAVKALSEGNYGKAAGKIISMVGDVAESVDDNAKVDWRELFKLNKVDDPLEQGIEGAKKKVTSKAAWAAAIVENGWENYKEHGGLTSRFFEETGVESAIDVGEAALIGIGVGAAAAAIGVTAPAWAIGAVAVGVGIAVDAGLDWIVKKVSGNPDAEWKEAASDFVCDTGEAVVKGTKKVVKNIWNAAVNGIVKKSSSVCWGNFSLGGGGL